MPNSKYWVFTDFDVTAERDTYLRSLWPDTVSQICYQEEECPDTHRRHFQGFLAVTEQSSMATIKATLDSLEVHVEPVRKCNAAAQNYCMKSETKVRDGFSYEAGINKVRGERTDLMMVKAKLDEGATLAEVYEAHFESSCRFSRFFKEYALLKQAPRCTEPSVYVLCGPTGTGKTRWVYDNFGQFGIFPKDPGNYWFDNYYQHHCVLIDEFDCGISLSYLLRLLDRYPMMVENKGCYVNFNSPNICITSNVPFDEWYGSAMPRQREALKRRITEFIDL